MSYRVRLPIFEGPFDLLLHLIKINEMDICDIPIADIAHKYLEYVQQMRDLDLDVAGDFLDIASRLVAMKAKQLLPDPEQEAAEKRAQEEESSGEALASAPFRQSPRDFMRQLIAYRKFKDLARQLSRRHAEQARVFYREAPAPEPPPEALAAQAEARQPGLEDLLAAFSRVLRYVDQKDSSHAVHQERYTVEEKIVHIEGLLRRDRRFDATEEFGRCFNKLELIVTLLAILELTRLRRASIAQEGTFGNIVIELSEPAEAEAAQAAGGD